MTADDPAPTSTRPSPIGKITFNPVKGRGGFGLGVGFGALDRIVTELRRVTGLPLAAVQLVMISCFPGRAFFGKVTVVENFPDDVVMTVRSLTWPGWKYMEHTV
ncbi:MAG: hypothetical protein ACYDGN_17115 [Acidimicrobiales bacterium]